MLKICILNAGQGDSIVLEYQDEASTDFAVIDSNDDGEEDPPALRKLRERGADRLSFVALTHPHADHFTGLHRILSAYSGRISSFFSYPVEHDLRLKKLAELYADVHRGTDSPTIKKRTREFIHILDEVRSNIGLDNWHEYSGEYSLTTPVGFRDVEVIAIMPPARVKGAYFQLIEKGDISAVDGEEDLNDLSLAFLVRYKGHEIVLGGDSTRNNWLNHRRLFERSNRELSASVVKLPHHGSRKDCADAVLDHIFSTDGDRVAIISAGGQSHPHPDTIKLLEKRGIKPYCTNLAKQCGANVRSLLALPEIDPVLRRMINSLGDAGNGVRQPCQGDICITIDAEGSLSVRTEHSHPCSYRGDFDSLFAQSDLAG